MLRWLQWAVVILFPSVASASADPAVLLDWMNGALPLDVDSGAPRVATGLVVEEDDLSVTYKSGWVFPVWSGRDAQGWATFTSAPRNADERALIPPPERRVAPEIVGYVFVGEGELTLRFSHAPYAWEFANHMVVDAHLDPSRLAPIAQRGAPWTDVVHTAIVLDVNPALSARIKALPRATDAEALAAGASARRAWTARHTELEADWIALDRMRVEQLGEDPARMRASVEVLTGTPMAWVADKSAPGEYDQWLSLWRDRSGWADPSRVATIAAVGNHPVEGWKSTDVAVTRQPPIDSTDPTSQRLPARRIQALTLDTTTLVKPIGAGGSVQLDMTHVMKVRAVGGPAQIFMLSVPLRRCSDGIKSIEVTDANGARVLLQDATRPDFLDEADDLIVVLPEPLAVGAETTLRVHVQDSVALFGAEAAVLMTALSDSPGMGWSSGLILAEPEIFPSAGADWVVTQRVGVWGGSNLGSALSGANQRTWEADGFRWREAKSEGRGAYVGFAVGAWINESAPASDGMPAMQVHLFQHYKDTIAGFLPELRRIITFYQGYLPPYPWHDLEVFQAPDEIGGYVWISPHGMVSVQSVRMFADTPGNPFRQDTPHLESGLLAHEMAHQWWAHNVRAATIQEGWMNESFSEAFADLYVGAAFGPSDLDARLEADRKFWENEMHGKDARASLPRAYEQVTQPQIVYEYGPYVLLRMLAPRLGKQAFFGALDVFQRDHAKKVATTEQLQAALEQASGKDLSNFFRYWVWQGWIPGVDLEWKSSGGVVDGTIRSDVPFGTFDVPVRLRLSDGTTSDVWVDVVDGVGTLHAPVGSTVKSVELDPDKLILAKWRRVRASRT